MTNPTRRTFVSTLGSGLLLGGSGWRPRLRLPPVADLILHGGEVHTVDPTDRIAQAIAIGEGKVLATGTTAQIKRLSGPRTEAIDLRGKTVIPGINDSHLHAFYWGSAQPPFMIDVSYPSVKSIADIAQRVRAAAAGRKPGEWIQGRGWDQPYFAERRAPTRQDLDQVAPDNPVLLTEFSGHAVWVNSRAMEATGVSRTTAEPPGGVIVKDAAGEPTGVFFESAAGLVRRGIPPLNEADRRRAIELGIEMALKFGITSFTEPGLPAAVVAAYGDLARSGKMRARLTALLAGGGSLEGLEQVLAAPPSLEGVDPKLVRVVGVKLHADGIPTGNKTAWLHQPYQTGGTGSLTIAGANDEERAATLRRLIIRVHQAGLQVGTHATGDRAIDLVVDSYLAAMAERPRPDCRHYVIHADLTTSVTLKRMGAAGIGANFNAAIKYLIMDGQLAALGPDRAGYEWPYRTALEAGVKVASSSDAPVTDGDWRLGLATCLLREGKQSGNVFGPSERITLGQALRTFTATGAWQDFAEGWKGTLEPGRVADLAVLDGKLSTTPPREFGSLAVTMTMLGGQVVYQRQGA